MYYMLKDANDEALADFEAMLAIQPEDINNRLMLAEVLMRADQLDRALEMLQAVEAPRVISVASY